MHEVPYRVVVDLQAALRQFGDQPAQGKVPCTASLDQPVAMAARNRARLMTAHLTGSNATGLPEAVHPVDCRANRHPELRRCRVPRYPAPLNRRNNSLSKIL